MSVKASIKVSWSDEGDQTYARQVIELACDDMMNRLGRRQIPGRDIELEFGPPPKRPSIGTAALVVHQGQLLMTLRAGSHGAGTWCPPGGHQEWGEKLGLAAERETLEETGVAVKVAQSLSYVDDFVLEWGTHYVTHFFLCSYVSGKARVVDPIKCPVVEWVPLGEVEHRELFLPFRHLLDESPTILDYCAKSLKNSPY